MTMENNGRPRIPAQALKIAESAVTSKSEFDALSTVSFPYLFHSEPLFGADMRIPSSWKVHVRVAMNESIRIPEIYIQVSNLAEQGLVRYDTAKLPGGDAETLKYINFDRVEGLISSAPFTYEEHMAVMVTPKMLADYLDKPFRMQISRPDKGIAFVVELPSEYVAGVLYLLNPEKYDVEAPKEIVGQSDASNAAAPSSSADTDPRIKKAGWIGLGIGIVSYFFMSFIASLAIGVVAAFVALVISHMPAKSEINKE